MMRHVTLDELNKLKENYKGEKHNCKYEEIFLLHPGQGLLNPKAYRLCKICSNMESIPINDKLQRVIDRILEKKKI